VLSIEYHHISVATWSQQPAVAQAEPRCDGATHLADRILQRQQLLLANVLRQHAWIRAICTRMSRSHALCPGRVQASRISRDLYPGLPQSQCNIRLVHPKIDREDTVLLGEEQFDHSVEPMLPSHDCNL